MNESTEFAVKFTNNDGKFTNNAVKFNENAPIILPYTVGSKSFHPWQSVLTPIGNATYTVPRQRLGSTPKRNRQYLETRFPV